LQASSLTSDLSLPIITFLLYIMMLERTYIHEVKGKGRKNQQYEELVVTQIGKYKYLVYNRMKDTAYYVDITYTGKIAWFSCECPAFMYNKGKCKHVDAVKQFIEDQKLEDINKNIAKENTAELIDFKD
jgi:predicted nucleic acid-binding Zn finger protein